MDDLRLFTLVNPENEEEVLAVGIDLGDEAITYRRAGGKPEFGVYESAERAHQLYNRMVTVRMVYLDESCDYDELLALLDRTRH